MKIHEAALQVMKQSGKPMTPAEVCAEIMKHGLFEFAAKDPASIVSSAIRKHSDSKANKGTVIFKKTAPGRFELA